MNQIKWFAVVGVLFSSLAQAALPPYYHRARIIGAILEEPRLEQAVTDSRFRQWSSGVVDGIVYRGECSKGSWYEVQSGRCNLGVCVKVVPVVDEEGHMIAGPGKLELTVGQSLRCR